MGLEETGLGRADDRALTQLGVHEGSTDEVQAGEGGSEREVVGSGRGSGSVRASKG